MEVLRESEPSEYQIKVVIMIMLCHFVAERDMSDFRSSNGRNDQPLLSGNRSRDSI